MLRAVRVEWRANCFTLPCFVYIAYRPLVHECTYLSQQASPLRTVLLSNDGKALPAPIPPPLLVTFPHIIRSHLFIWALLRFQCGVYVPFVSAVESLNFAWDVSLVSSRHSIPLFLLFPLPLLSTYFLHSPQTASAAVALLYVLFCRRYRDEQMMIDPLLAGTYIYIFRF